MLLNGEYFSIFVSMKKIAVFASGTGSNAMNLIRYFSDNLNAKVHFVLSNNESAKVLDSAKKLGIKTYCFSNQQVSDGSFLVELCRKEEIDYIVLAGYLRLIPKKLIDEYPKKMINLHPSLLPKYGGKGMYGTNVHKAVLESKERESGITIHFVNEVFDKGQIIAQFHCSIEEEDTLFSIEKKIRILEHSYLPKVVETVIMNETLF